MVLDILRGAACDRVAGGLETQRLVDHPGDERAVLDDLSALVGVFGEEFGEPADEPPGGFVAGAGQHCGVGVDLGAGERACHAVFVFELGVEQRGHQVVGGVLGAPFDVVGEHVAAGDLVLLDDHGLAGLGAQVGVGAVAYRFLVLFGDAEEHADDAHGQHRARVR